MNVKELEELVLSLQKKLDRATAEISKLKAECSSFLSLHFSA